MTEKIVKNIQNRKICHAKTDGTRIADKGVKNENENNNENKNNKNNNKNNN